MKINEVGKALLHLASVSGVGIVTAKRILSYLGGINGIERVYSLLPSGFVEAGVSPKLAQKIIAGLQDFSLLHSHIAALSKQNVSVVFFFEDHYPELLKQTFAPPLFLYCQGQLPANNGHFLSIVGSRRANNYGRRVTAKLVAELSVLQDLYIVSGGAVGLDTFAHLAALKSGLRTVVVLGSGITKPYPSENKVLFNKIIDAGGAILSSFSPDCSPLPANFPVRNRIIAGLSSATLVVQAPQKSGALITAKFALDYGRDVLAVPGSIEEPINDGCHSLIGEGAKLIASGEAIIEEVWGNALRERVFEEVPWLIANCPNSIVSETRVAEKGPEQQILDLCQAQPRPFDEIEDVFEFAEQELTDLLFNLQLRGLLRQNICGDWETQ